MTKLGCYEIFQATTPRQKPAVKFQERSWDFMSPEIVSLFADKCFSHSCDGATSWDDMSGLSTGRWHHESRRQWTRLEFDISTVDWSDSSVHQHHSYPREACLYQAATRTGWDLE